MTLKEVHRVTGHRGGGGVAENRVWISLTDQNKKWVKIGRQQDKNCCKFRMFNNQAITFSRFQEFPSFDPGSLVEACTQRTCE